MSSELTHFDDSGASRMVDVGAKEITARVARAEAFVEMRPETLALIRDRKLAKGDVFEVSRLAGIMAAKQASNLIPLCHILPLEGVTIDFDPVSDTTLRIETLVKVTAKTGVEMEALTAACVAALTVYDMCKAVDKGMTIGPVRLLEKSGGRSGHFQRAPS
jgi:cyclic pyranopterin monophosphate synthase